MPAARHSATTFRIAAAAAVGVAALAAWCWWLLRAPEPVHSVVGGAHAAAARASDGVLVEAPATGAVRRQPDPQPATNSVERAPAPPPVIDGALRPPDTIAGTVTDEDGAPIEGAVVYVAGHDGEVRTGVAGGFSLARAAGDPRAVAIRGIADESRKHEDLVATRWVQWGTQDLQFMLRRNVAVEIELVDTEDKSMTAGVTFGGEDEHINDSQSTYSFRVSRGWHTLRCWVDDDTRAPPPARRVEVTAPCRLRIVLGPWVERTIVVVDKDGAPVTSSRVELLVDEQPARDDGDAPRTDERGRAVVRGSGVDAYSVRVTGVHAPVVVDGVRLDVREPLVVRLANDARLHVRLSPPGVVDRMRDLGSWIGLRGARDRTVRPQRLVAPDVVEFHAAPGAWELALLDGPLAGALANITLVAGDATTIDVDLPRLQLAYVSPTVVCTQPDVPNYSYVYLSREPRAGDAFDRAVALGVPAYKNDVCIVPPGRYRARLVAVPQSQSDEIVDVPPDATIDARFRVRLGNVVIRLVDGSGEPRRDVRVGLARDGVLSEDDELSHWTDGDGVVRSQCGVGTLQVVMLPTQPYTLTRNSRSSSPVPLRANVEPRTFVGTITVREGATTEATFVLR